MSGQSGGGSQSQGGWDFAQYTSHLNGSTAGGSQPDDNAPAFGTTQGGTPTGDPPQGWPTDGQWTGGGSQAASPRALPAPVPLLAGAAGVAVVGAALAVLLGAPVFAALGWLLSGPAAIGLVAAYMLTDTKRRTQPTYSPPTWVSGALIATLVIILLGVVAASLQLAFWVGRL
ncbi:hypothetical protein [Pseudoclavibacter helvolus]|uniref:hypothetical protein n=1 Tax=Pseudoclavibacter helvolus TaxID=255205 RepID=UPI003735738B